MSFDFFSKGLFLSYMNAGFSRKGRQEALAFVHGNC